MALTLTRLADVLRAAGRAGPETWAAFGEEQWRNR